MMEKTSNNRIGQDFTTLGLAKFAAPAFFMNVFTQIFRSLDDALFISRYVGESALAALNLLNPINCVQLAIGHLFSLGSANISARLMGEDKQNDAKQVFSKIVISTAIVGSVFALIINLLSSQILTALGADQQLANYASWQIRIVYSIAPISLINSVFSTYFATAGKPKMGMICSIVNGVSNILLDLILVAYLNLGVLGAAIATAVGEILVFIIGLLFFINSYNEIHFIKPAGKFVPVCLESFSYALPQCVNSLSIAVTSLITNNVLLNMLGSNGVAANAVISDVRAIITSGLIGVAISIGPIISYNFGNKNTVRLKKILTSVLKIWSLGSIILIGIGMLIKRPLVSIFMSKNSSEDFFNMALFGLTIEIFSVPFTAGCVTISRMFIALANSKASTFISVFRNLIIKSLSLIILPLLLNTTGIWLAIPVSEALSFTIAVLIVYKNRNNYGYGKSGQALLINPTSN